MNIFKLFGSIFVENDKANKSISETDKKAESLGKKFLKGTKTVAKFGAAVGTMAVAAGAGMVKLAKQTGDMADELLDLQSQTGMSTDELQKWRRVATVAGVSTDAMADASKKLTKTLDTMSEGTGKAAEAAEELGFSYEDLMAMDADERMNVLVEALGNVEDTTDRAKIGTDLFGGAWDDIAPILDVGAEKMKEIKDNADIISEDDLVKANDFRIRVDEMQEKVALFGQRLALEAMPFLEEMMDLLEEHGPAIEDLFTATLEAVQALLPFLVEVLEILTKIIEAAVTALEKGGEVVQKSREAEATGESRGVFTGSSKHRNVPSRISGFFNGGETLDDGVIKVGERGPELLSVPRGANVKPLDGGMGNVVNMHVTVDGGFINEQGVEDFTNMMVDFITGRGVQVI